MFFCSTFLKGWPNKFKVKYLCQYSEKHQLFFVTKTKSRCFLFDVFEGKAKQIQSEIFVSLFKKRQLIFATTTQSRCFLFDIFELKAKQIQSEIFVSIFRKTPVFLCHQYIKFVFFCLVVFLWKAK